MDTDLRSDDIRPTDAACYLYAFENPLTGLSPAVAFAVDVECEYVECSDDEEEWEEDVAVSVEWIPFTGRTWRDLVSLSLTDVECYTDGTSPRTLGVLRGRPPPDGDAVRAGPGNRRSRGR